MRAAIDGVSRGSTTRLGAMGRRKFEGGTVGRGEGKEWKEKEKGRESECRKNYFVRAEQWCMRGQEVSQSSDSPQPGGCRKQCHCCGKERRVPQEASYLSIRLSSRGSALLAERSGWEIRLP